MSRLLETIKLVDGVFMNLKYHERRMEYALEELYGERRKVNLESYLRKSYVPPQGLHRCRVVYDGATCDVAYWPYTRRRVETIKVIDGTDLHYAFKFEDRAAINELVEHRGECDDILIIKNGWVTDASYANIAFRRGDAWFTPDTPLLKGTMRQKLIDEGKISPASISVNDIQSFETFKLINAMLEFDSPEIDVSRILL